MIDDLISYLKAEQSELQARGARRAAIGCEIAWLQLVGLREDAAQENETPDERLAMVVVQALMAQLEKDAPEEAPRLREGVTQALGRA